MTPAPYLLRGDAGVRLERGDTGFWGTTPRTTGSAPSAAAAVLGDDDDDDGRTLRRGDFPGVPSGMAGVFGATGVRGVGAALAGVPPPLPLSQLSGLLLLLLLLLPRSRTATSPPPPAVATRLSMDAAVALVVLLWRPLLPAVAGPRGVVDARVLASREVVVLSTRPRGDRGLTADASLAESCRRLAAGDSTA